MEAARETDRMNVAQAGMRAARARDPKLLKVLEQASTVMDRASEDQMGRTRRSTDIFSHTVEHTEVQLVKKAYEFADKGDPVPALCWIYGCAALYLSYVD
jgi:hypothetical protein